MPIDWLKPIFRRVLGRLYRVELNGMHHYHAAGPRVVMIANHTSFLDGIMLTLFLPDRLGFVVNTHIARLWWVKPFLYFIDVFLLDHTRPFILRKLIRYVQGGGRAVIFPEGRITLTGSLMKVYPGSGLAVDRSDAVILPVRIDGLQYTPASRLGGRVRLRWFPKVRLTILPPQQLSLDKMAHGRARRTHATRRIADLMSEMVFTTGLDSQTLCGAFHEALEVNGGDHIVVDNIDRRTLTYAQLLGVAHQLRSELPEPGHGQRAGLMFPACPAIPPIFLACLASDVVSVFMSPWWSVDQILEVSHNANIGILYYSGRMMTRLGRSELVSKLTAAKQGQGEGIKQFIDIDPMLDPLVRQPPRYRRSWKAAHTHSGNPDSVAVVLPEFHDHKLVINQFTHGNLLAARQQMVTRFDFGAQDVIFSVWPAHTYPGLVMGLILPLLSGMRTYLYPMVRRHRIASELIYDMGATLVTGPATALQAYARVAHAYDFYNVRYALVFERLEDELMGLYWKKLGVRVFEGCRDPQTGVFLSLNTPMEHKTGSSGRILPGMKVRLAPSGSSQGRLQVRCATLPLAARGEGDASEAIRHEAGSHDTGWHDTGLQVRLDERNFLFQPAGNLSGRKVT